MILAEDIKKRFYEKNVDISIMQAAQSGVAIMNMNILDDKYNWSYMHQKFKSLEERNKFQTEVQTGAVGLNKKYAKEVFLT